MKTNHIVIMIVVAILTGAVGFWGGMQYQQSRRSTFAGQFGGAGAAGGRTNGGFGRFQGGQGGGQNALRPVVGKIISSDDKSITVQLQDNSSKIVIFSKTVSITKTTTGSSTDLKEGTSVAVFGTTNSDGSMTAQNIQINPMFGLRRGMTGTPAAQ